MMKSVVITGSTRGIGYHLAAAFLGHDCAVSISGRTREAVEEAVNILGEKYNRDMIYGFPCDVTDYIQVERLWENAKTHYGRIDIWINNAGIALPMMNFWQVPPEQYEEVVQTNILGTMYGIQVALTGMISQGFGALYNMEGFGARGRTMKKMTLYGSTKASVHFINQSLAKEIEGSSVIAGAIAPGMMITDLVTSQFIGREQELERAKRILNIIAEKPETVAPVLVEKILNNRKNGATIAFSSSFGMLLKFFAAPFRNRDLFS
jgi:NAD(P)-dependent dehydrogenase (short-subunit alcohol dehydrogenase family)